MARQAAGIAMVPTGAVLVARAVRAGRMVRTCASYWAASLHSGVRTSTGLDIPGNGGCHRPVKIVCPPRTIFTAERPVPTYLSGEGR